MKEALRETIRYAFSGMKLHSIEAKISPGNEASIRLVEDADLSGRIFPRRLFHGTANTMTPLFIVHWKVISVHDRFLTEVLVPEDKHILLKPASMQDLCCWKNSHTVTDGIKKALGLIK